MVSYFVEGHTGAGWVRLASPPSEGEARKVEATLRDEGTFREVRTVRLTITLEVVTDAPKRARKPRTPRVTTGGGNAVAAGDKSRGPF